MQQSFYAFLIVILCIIVCGRGNKVEDSNDMLSFDNTTVMRGIAILMVVVHHLSLWFGTNILTSWGGGGVAIFMILSGYGLTMSFKNSGVKRYWWKRFVGIFIPWLVVILITMQPWNLFDEKWFWEYLFFIDHGPWYMQYLFVWYILFYMAHCSRWTYSIRWYIVGIAAIVMFLFWEPMQQEQSLCFPLGMWIGENYERVKKIDKRGFLRMSVVAAVVAILALVTKQIPYIRSDVSSWTFIILQVILKTSMAVAVMAAVPFLSRIKESRYLLFTGVISYEIYLMHGFIYEQLFGLMGGEHTIWFVICFFPVLYALCYLIYRIDEGLANLLNFSRNKMYSFLS